MVYVGVAQVTPYGDVREAQDQRMFPHGAVSHHVFVHVAAAQYLRRQGSLMKTLHLHHHQVAEVMDRLPGNR